MAAINFNGKEYASVEEMPPDLRQLYEMAMALTKDDNHDGLPDLFADKLSADATVVQSQQFIVDGKVYTSLDELPLEAREHFAAALRHNDADGDGTIDMFQGILAAVGATPAAEPPTAAPDLVQEVGGTAPNPAAIWIILGFVVAVIVAVAIVLYVMR
jgi:hypothetical protein